MGTSALETELTDSEMKRDVAASRALVPEARDLRAWCLDDATVGQKFGPFKK